MSFWFRLSNVFRTAALDRDLDDEQRFHLEARIDDLVRRGVPHEAAAAEAARRFGSPLRAREASRDVKLLPWLESLVQDVRFGLRMLWKDRGVTGAAVVSLGLAIGACAAAFSLVDALVLKPLPVREPDRLVYLTFPSFEQPDGADRDAFNYPLFQRFREAAGSQIDLFGASYNFRYAMAFSDARGREEHVRLQYVSGRLFEILGVEPAHGRLLSAADDRIPGEHRVAVLSHAFWQRRFAGDPSAIGRRVTFGGHTFEIVGVARRGFTGVEPGTLVDLWVPNMMFSARALTDPHWGWFRVMGRLGPGVEAPQIHGVLQSAFTQSLHERVKLFPPDVPRKSLERFLRTPLRVRPAANGPSTLRRQFERPLWILAAIVGLVLLVAGSNVTNLFLARAASREREMSLRISIGAGRGRLVQQVLIESGVLSLGACALALPFAAVVSPAVVSMLAPADSPAFLDLRVDWRVLTFLATVGLVATALLGLAPALRASGASPIGALKSTGGRVSPRRGGLRPLLVLQMTFSAMVLFVAGLLLASFGRLTSVDLGFDPQRLLLVSVDSRTPTPPEAGYLRVGRLLDHVRRLPGVESASVAERSLFSGFGWSAHIRLPGRPPDTNETTFLRVSDGFFETMRIPLREGRTFRPDDSLPEQPSGVIVSEAFVRRYFDRGPAIGRGFSRDDRNGPVSFEIQGVVADVKYQSVREPAPPIVYVPLRGMGTLHVRTAQDPLAFAGAIRLDVERFEPSLRVTNITQQSTLVGNSLLRERLLALLSGFFAALGLALAGVGLYGVLNYSVVQRTKEIGIRTALGAGPRAVIGSVLAATVGTVLLGGALGMAGGLYLARFVRTLLFEVDPLDPASAALPGAALLIAAAVASVLPARRAARIDPAVALRYE